MKKVSKIVLSTLMALACVLSFAACNEGAPQKTSAMGVAVRCGYDNCVTEATVIVDGYGQPVRVRIDDIFPLTSVCVNDTTKPSWQQVALDADAEKVTVGNVEYIRYVRIGDRYFEASATDGKYNEIGVENGLQDFWGYYTSTETNAGVEMYYKAYLDKKLYTCKLSDESDPKATKVGEIYLANSKAFTTSNGAMRKRTSKYWNIAGNMLSGSELGFNGNMERLEDYLLAYGFSALEGDIKSTVLTPSQAGGNYNVVAGVTTGATLGSHAYMYLTVAYDAYKIALENQKAL